MALQILKADFLALLQDYGRYGYQNIAVTTGGPLDELAFLWANYLLDNNYNAPQLEISYGNFSAKFTKNTMIAICGADLRATLNNHKITPWQSYYVTAGSVINFSSPISGLHCYLAIKSGFIVKKKLSSCSTVSRNKLGGLQQNGVKLMVGDVINYNQHPATIKRQIPTRFIAKYQPQISLRYIPNTQFADQSIHKMFAKKSYQVTQNIDRMGYRLSGETIPTHLTGVISHGVSLGSIQIPKDGQPIVLMRDRPTMGGYPLIGCVAYLDLSLLAQSVPGTKVTFIIADINTLTAELLTHKRFFNTRL